jgi:NAD(P)-dependent dehydrogenase (short-subunit alcohol dehydrogenase family)
MIERKPVLITGASSGIGEVTARELVRRGFRVFAGVRTSADGARLAAQIGPRCTPVNLDVTDAASIAVSAPLEYLPLAELRRQFEVNVIGALAVTQALLPFLRRSLGRVVNVGSIAGRTALPIAGPYGASKAALDMLTQTLRMELQPFDVLVAYIEPGSHRTPIWERSRRSATALRTRLPALAIDYYGDAIDAIGSLMTAAERRAADPLPVAAAIAHALESAHPRARYTIGKDTRTRFVLGVLPTQLKERAIRRRLASATRAGG